MNRVRKTPQPLVVFAHGNGAYDYQMPIVKGINDWDCHRLLNTVDMVGLTDSLVKRRCRRRVFLDRLLKRKDIDPARIVYRTLPGGGVLASLSNRRSPAVSSRVHFVA